MPPRSFCVVAFAFCALWVLAGALVPLSLKPLPLGTIRPTGWLRSQLEGEARGLAGHLQHFWVDVQQSAWVGGKGDGTNYLNERLPYWINGIVPLIAALPEDSPTRMELDQDVQKIFNIILNGQKADGSLGPQNMNELHGDWYWSKYDVILALLNFAEFHPQNRTRIEDAVYKLLGYMDRMMANTTLQEWAAARWQDFALALEYLYDREEKADRKALLLHLLLQAHEQGYDWNTWFTSSSFPHDEVPANKATLLTHGVNCAQGLKTGAVWYRVSQNRSDLSRAFLSDNILQRWHGQATGMFTCDEHLAGRMPSHGSELCAVVELMFSYEVMLSVSGNMSMADELERLAFNALPAEVTKDLWAHQYLQEVNQYHAETINGPLLWKTDGPDSIQFGLESNYGCCTANYDQGWSKFAASLILENADGSGLTLAVIAPFTLVHGQFGAVSVSTGYPFEDTYVLNMNCSRSYTLSFRIPGFVLSATVSLNEDGKESTIQLDNGTVGHAKCASAASRTQVRVHLHQQFSVERRFNNAVAVSRGPLLFGAFPGEVQSVKHHYAFDSNDLRIMNTSRWNVALQVNISHPNASFHLYHREGGVAEMPFSSSDPPCVAVAMGTYVDWPVEFSVAAAPPVSPVAVTGQTPVFPLLLLPYGATNLRMAELPWFHPPFPPAAEQSKTEHQK